MDFIDDVMDADLIPQVYVLDAAGAAWRPLLRDDPLIEEDIWDIL